LLDFGVSKLLLAQPDAGDAGRRHDDAPDYASPEQVLGEPVTVASDIYSLGAVLYELLSGARPHHIDKCTPLALRAPFVWTGRSRQCRREVLAHSHAGSLEIWTTSCSAMHKQPERRYPSVEQMAADIRRHLEHRPIVARPESRAIARARFVRRNRIAVALATVVAASLIGGTAVAMQLGAPCTGAVQDVRTLATRFVFDVERGRENCQDRCAFGSSSSGRASSLGNLAQSSANDWPLQRKLATAYCVSASCRAGGDVDLGDPAGALDSFGRGQRATGCRAESLTRRPTKRPSIA
jgi:hypothetical protein